MGRQDSEKHHMIIHSIVFSQHSITTLFVIDIKRNNIKTVEENEQEMTQHMVQNGLLNRKRARKTIAGFKDGIWQRQCRLANNSQNCITVQIS